MKGNETVECHFDAESINTSIIPEQMSLDIIYEDDHMVVINKPAGLVVHPGSGNHTGTLLNGLLFHFQQLSRKDSLRPGIVHRLDKDTSGVILVAKNDKSHENLSKQFASHGKDGELQRAYKALVWGVPNNKLGEIKNFIGRSHRNRKKMTVFLNKKPNNKNAVTYWKKIKSNKELGFSIRCLSDELSNITIHVPDDFSTIQEAIDYSIDGDSILVSAGTYYENINFNGKNISIIGEDRETTIIDGGGIIDGFGNGSVVTFQSGEDSTAVLSGFTIKGGTGTGIDDERLDGWGSSSGYIICGGGILIDYFSSPTLNSLVIEDNYAYEGGGIFSLISTLNISNSIIRNNGFDSSPSNHSTLDGGAIYAMDSDCTVKNVLIENNSSFMQGQAIVLDGSEMELDYVTITENTTDDSWVFDIIILWGGSSLSISNSIIWNNYTEGMVNECYDDYYYYNYYVPNCAGVSIGEASTMTITYSNIQGEGLEGEGNISEDPLFTDPENGDFTLQPLSPCIDAGDPESELDPDGTIADMGAYYFHQQGLAGDPNLDGMINIFDIIITIDVILDNYNGGDEPTDHVLWSCDVNNDNNVDISDIITLINLILNF